MDNLEFINLIPKGNKNAIKRDALVSLSGISDRIMRKCIEIARRTVPILNLSNGNGYFIPEKENEVDMALLAIYIKQEEHRIKSIEKSIKVAKEFLIMQNYEKGKGEQVNMFDMV